MGWFSSLCIVPMTTPVTSRASHLGRKLKGRVRPNSKPTVAGTNVMARTPAIAIAKVLVNARGLNRRPSCPSSVNTGRKATAITNKAKKLGPPTSLIAVTSTAERLPGRPSASQCSSFL